MINPIKEGIENHVREVTKEVAFGILEGIRDVIVDLSYSIALIGGGLGIVFYLSGWDKGRKLTGMLIVGYTLIKYLLG